ncbi:MAG: archease [Thermoleophilia bacterium]
MSDQSRRWADRGAGDCYRELDHPADLWLEVQGDSLSSLAENALFALFDTMVSTEDVATDGTAELSGVGAEPAEALRSLLAEALFLFDTQRFAAAGAKVTAEMLGETGETRLRATLWGETLRRDRHRLKTEVKAVTHHLLRVVDEGGKGWRATLILDV